MKLITAAIERTLPPIYSQEGVSDPVARVKYFTPDSNWTWLVIEGERNEQGDLEFFGQIRGLDTEHGYFTLSQLSTYRGSLGLPVERDLYFEPKPLSQVK